MNYFRMTVVPILSTGLAYGGAFGTFFEKWRNDPSCPKTIVNMQLSEQLETLEVRKAHPELDSPLIQALSWKIASADSSTIPTIGTKEFGHSNGSRFCLLLHKNGSIDVMVEFLNGDKPNKFTETAVEIAKDLASFELSGNAIAESREAGKEHPSATIFRLSNIKSLGTEKETVQFLTRLFNLATNQNLPETN